ncbi:MAG: nucleoside recognition domain-containing protein, partial [Tannerellaceae bacterium]
MVLNYIWISFFLIAFVVAIGKAIFLGDLAIFGEIINSSFTTAKSAFEISLGLTGVLTLWLGIMKIGENGGMVQMFARLAAPLFGKLFPSLPKDHPATGSIFMNISANLLGLDNAATPMGLKAMQEMQELNKQKDAASDPMIMFLVLNASGLTLIPISVMAYRAQLGAANPSDVFLPILIATFAATVAGIVAVCIKQRIKIFDKTLMSFFGIITTIIVGSLYAFNRMTQEEVSLYSSFIANLILFGVIVGFIISAVRKKINVYDSFIEGAKDGFKTAVTIIPYLVAILVSIGMFRASGAMDYLIDGIAALFTAMGMNSDFVAALPTAFMKPLSGSGARGLMIDTMNHYGADSFVGRLSCIFQGATDTTFYIVAVYYGSIGVKNTRYTISCSLLADLFGIIAAIVIAY